MFLYNLKQALIGIKQRPWLTFLMIMAIGIGIGIFMTALTMVYQGQKVDLPHKSDKLTMVLLDSRAPSAQPVDHFKDMPDLTYQDAVNLNQLAVDNVKSTFTWLTDQIVNIDDSQIKPYRGYSIVTTHNFFDMMDIDFIYGGPWSEAAEQAAEPVVVLTKMRNDQLFGGENSVGKQIRLDNHLVTVVGVMDDWKVRYRFYDRSYIQGLSDDAYLPYKYAIGNNLKRNARFQCWENTNMNFQNNNIEQLITSECGWVTFWAQIDNASDLANYRSQVYEYVAQQRQFGRFARQDNHYFVNLNQIMDWVHNNNVDNKFYFLIGGLFMAACVFSAIGVILAKFMRKRNEVSVRRALGAKRRVLIVQYLSEVGLVGAIGGLVGVVVSAGALHLMKLKTFHSSSFYADIHDLDKLFQLDWLMMVTAIIVAVFSAILIGIVPIWQVCHVQISQHLKVH